MPRVGETLGIVFYVYADDHDPPHVHAIHGDNAILIEIATSNVLAGWMPASQRREAVAWVENHRELVREAWFRLNPPTRGAE